MAVLRLLLTASLVLLGGMTMFAVMRTEAEVTVTVTYDSLTPAAVANLV